MPDRHDQIILGKRGYTQMMQHQTLMQAMEVIFGTKVMRDASESHVTESMIKRPV